ncbi:HTH domain-containing protein [Cellulosimicrobium aquatile]|uniref:HTH domain-containing protein n=1 Tax=Cellulosimicrobium aquatile TaxID=1612203 RepID=A0A1N6RLB8_9MICO|nr:WYL domain-containing protein [Cellulosimicrobium aquatile]SIQ29589.1 HTH domain-containing protein [Cellulosimicrobium aquatile]
MTETSRRTLLLLALLQARPDRTGPELAARLGVDARTVRRDVDRLRELGYHVVATRGRVGGYRLDAGAELPPLLFDDEQVVALTVALRTITASGVGDDLAEAAVRALTTVRQVLPARLRHRVDAVDVTTVAPTPGRPAVRLDLDVLLAVSAAARRREMLRFDYAAVALDAPPEAIPDVSPGATSGTVRPDDPRAGVRQPRRAEVHHVVVHDGRWYAVAWDLDRDDWRTFRLDRMTPRTPTGPRFAAREVPGGDVGAFVAARFTGAVAGPVPPAGSTTAGSTATGSTAHRASGTAATSSSPGAWEAPATRWPCEGWVELAAPARVVAPFVEDGAVEAAGPERCRVRLGSWSWVALAARVAAFDADLLAAGPAELVAACDAVARRLGAVAAS